MNEERWVTDLIRRTGTETELILNSACMPSRIGHIHIDKATVPKKSLDSEKMGGKEQERERAGNERCSG